MTKTFNDDWQDQDIQEWLQQVEKNKGSERVNQLKEEYRHWDFQLLSIGDNDIVLEDFNGNQVDEEAVKEGLADIAYKIFEEATVQ